MACSANETSEHVIGRFGKGASRERAAVSLLAVVVVTARVCRRQDRIFSLLFPLLLALRVLAYLSLQPCIRIYRTPHLASPT